MNEFTLPSAGTIPVLETGRLRLRPYTPDDVDSLLELFTDEQVITAFGYRMQPTAVAASGIIGRWQEEFKNGTGIRWAMEEKASGSVIGNIGLKDIKAYHRNGAIGYAILPARWRRGMATEAMEMVLQHAFDTLHLHRIEAVVFLHNERSQVLLERQGFLREGLLKSSYRFDGHFHDSYLYAKINPREQA